MDSSLVVLEQVSTIGHGIKIGRIPRPLSNSYHSHVMD